MSLEVKNLAAGYGDLRVVKDVSLRVEPGSVTGMLGRNGAGKTSTLLAVAGMLQARSGSVVLDGRDITRAAPARRPRHGLSLVQEGKRIFRQLTVDENLVVGSYGVRRRKSELEARKDEIYQLFPVLTERRREQASRLSGGQQQMLAIGQALMADPRYLMLDEPSAGLAPSVVAVIFDLISLLRERGCGILLVEQSVEFTLGLADTITVIDLGRSVLDCRPGDPHARQAIADAYLSRVDASVEPLVDKATT